MSYQICNRCILDSNIPGIKFSKNGVCNFCEEYSQKEKPGLTKDATDQEKEFLELIKNGRNNSQYDCLCLYSGGKDSTNMLYNLVSRLKLRVLAFTLDNWFLSPQTYNNIRKVVSILNVDHMFYKPEWDMVAYLFRLGIKGFDKNKESKRMAFLIGHICWPCFVMISIFSIKTALEKNIPNIVVGTTPGQLIQKKEDLLTKYKGIPDVYQSMIRPFISIIDKEHRKKFDLSFISKIKALGLKLIPFYEYFRYSEELAFKISKEKFNWERPEDTDSCSTNCLVNALGIALHKKYYKISPYLIPLAYDVRAGLVDRQEALKAVNMRLNDEMVRQIAQKLGLLDEV